MADLPALAADGADLLDALLASLEPATDAAVGRCSAAHGQPLTRFGIYKIVRRHAARFDDPRTDRKVSPHTFRHTAAVHLLEAGVEVNVIRGWLGHADLTTTNRYAEINTKAKLAALRASEPTDDSAGPRTTPIWRTRTSPSSTGSLRSDRYVAENAATGPFAPAHRWPPPPPAT